MNRTNRLLVNFNDACIYESDVNLLRNKTAWLNDACIHFQQTRISHQIQQQRQQEKCNNPCHVTIVDPSVVSFLVTQQQQQDTLDDDDCKTFQNTWLGTDKSASSSCLLSNNDPNISLLFIPINDDYMTNYSQSFMSSKSDVIPTNQPRGNHWSFLLVVVLVSHTAHYGDTKQSQQSHHDKIQIFYFHIDSMSCLHNSNAARITAITIQHILTRDISSSIANTTITLPTVIECHVPQQTNGYDCGICTVAYTEKLSQDVDTWIHDHHHHHRLLLSTETTTHHQQPLLNPKVWQEWIEQTLKQHVDTCHGIEAMAKTVRQNMIHDIHQLCHHYKEEEAHGNIKYNE